VYKVKIITEIHLAIPYRNLDFTKRQPTSSHDTDLSLFDVKIHYQLSILPYIIIIIIIRNITTNRQILRVLFFELETRTRQRRSNLNVSSLWGGIYS